MTRPTLTDSARKNIESGHTDGAGTDVCRKCGGPKEPNRLNSGRCKSCDGGGDRSIPAAKPRDESDAALAWIVRHRLTLPLSVPNKRADIVDWAKVAGFPGDPVEVRS